MKKQELFNELFVSFAALPAVAFAKAGFAPFAVKEKSGLIIPFLVISALTAIPLSSYSQNEKNFEQSVYIAEDLAQDIENEALIVYLEQLNELTDNPVNINSADESEISRLFFLNDFQVKALADHVKNTGKIVSVYEIVSVAGFDRPTVEMIIPFIDLSVNAGYTPDTFRIHNSFISNFIFKPGESDTSDIGSSFKHLSKYRFSSGRFAGGFTTEKDAGEKLFDFFSGNLSFSGKGVLKKIIIGDFGARSGQGLNVNTGMRTGLLLTSSGYMASRSEIRPYTSTGENNFFRGIALHAAYKKTEIITYFSHNKIDATLYSPEDSTVIYVKNFYEAGLHNTSNLLQKKDAVTETSFGTNMLFSFRNLKAGFCYSESRFSKPVTPDITDPVNLFGFSGRVNRTASAYYSTIIKRILLFGELAVNDYRDRAFVQGITLRPSDRLAINLLYRNYSPRYFSFHGSGPGSSTSTGNEKGLLGNFTFEAAKHLFISAGADVYVSPWLRYNTGFPSLARRTEVKMNYRPSESLDLQLTYNIRCKQEGSDVMTGIKGIGESTVRWLKGQVRYSPAERITLATRLDCKFTDNSGSRGILFLQDLRFRFAKAPLTIWARYCIFNTEDWDSRIYTYENDLLQSFSIPALSGRGTRSYIMINWEAGKHSELRVKYSVTSVDEAGQSTGKNELKCQFRIWF